MQKTSIRELVRNSSRYADEQIEIKGWIRSNRDQKSFGFLNISDGTHFNTVQVVYARDALANYQEVAKLRVGAAVKILGVFLMTPDSKQPFEIEAGEISLLGDSPEDYPIQPKRHTREFLRQVAHLRPRTNLFTAVFRVRSLLAYAIHMFFQERGFIYVNTPIITANDAEGAGELFQVTTVNLQNLPLDEENRIDYKKDFFGRRTNLTVSGQLEAEAFALAFRDVYTFGPTFRAENSNTPRHVAEFWMVEPEMAFADIHDNMVLAEDMVKFLISYIFQNAPEEIEFFNRFVDKGLYKRLQNVLDSEFAQLTYDEAVKIITESGEQFEYQLNWGIDLQTEHERFLAEKVFKKPVFVVNYPREIKAFYMRHNEDGKTVAAMDLLVPGVGEIIGGSQREERESFLAARIKELGIDEEELRWYLELRRYGGVEHAGFGLGFERLIMYLTGVSNIRDVIPFPRTVKSCEF